MALHNVTVEAQRCEQSLENVVNFETYVRRRCQHWLRQAGVTQDRILALVEAYVGSWREQIGRR
jgi:hypothetical protein